MVKLAEALIKCNAFLPLVGNGWRYEIGWAAMLEPVKIPQRLKRAEMFK